MFSLVKCSHSLSSVNKPGKVGILLRVTFSDSWTDADEYKEVTLKTSWKHLLGRPDVVKTICKHIGQNKTMPPARQHHRKRGARLPRRFVPILARIRERINPVRMCPLRPDNGSENSGGMFVCIRVNRRRSVPESLQSPPLQHVQLLPCARQGTDAVLLPFP